MLRTNPLNQLTSAHFRHGDVSEDEINGTDAMFRKSISQCVKAIFRFDDLIAERAQDAIGQMRGHQRRPRPTE